MKINVLHDYGGIVTDGNYYRAGLNEVPPYLALRMIEHGIAEALPEPEPEPLPEPEPELKRKVKR